jgi:alkanesulfonate monooxygenase SsuD/methylene tetrahydromethanopterin reductase-like flavin-dependent oxidoreductase (luciferase family)
VQILEDHHKRLIEIAGFLGDPAEEVGRPVPDAVKSTSAPEAQSISVGRLTLGSSRAGTSFPSKAAVARAAAYSIVGDSDAEAEAQFKWIDSQIDEEATSRFVGRATQQPETSFQHGFKELLRQTALGLTGYWNVGNPDKQAETIRALHEAGYEGV